MLFYLSIYLAITYYLSGADCKLEIFQDKLWANMSKIW